MDPRHCEADNFMEQLGFLAEAFQMIDCLLDETLGLAARAIPALRFPRNGFLSPGSNRSSAIWNASRGNARSRAARREAVAARAP
jgi:hypothetical protein